MEAWGIIMTVFTMFGMLVLMVATVTTDDGFAHTENDMGDAASSQGESLKEAA